jgi:hypothetical protein
VLLSCNDMLDAAHTTLAAEDARHGEAHNRGNACRRLECVCCG